MLYSLQFKTGVHLLKVELTQLLTLSPSVPTKELHKTKFKKYVFLNLIMNFRTSLIKLRSYEKATKFEKNLPPTLTKQPFLLSSIKGSGRFKKKIYAFLQKLDFSVLNYFYSE